MSKTPYENVTNQNLTSATQQATINYTYSDSSWSDKLTAYDGQAIVYDASGNPTTYRGATLTWNGRLLTSYEKDNQKFEYTYNTNGLRATKKVYRDNELGLICTYIWDGTKLLGQELYMPSDGEADRVVVKYIYDDSDNAIGLTYNDYPYIFEKNIQGDVIGIYPAYNSTGILKLHYDAWGNVYFDRAGNLVEAMLNTLLMSVNNISYRGYFCDNEIGLYYLQSRYYDPETGRFINADDTDYLAYDGMPVSFNLFAYCCNDPVNKIDSKGNFAITGVAASYLLAISAAVLAYAACTAILNQYNATIGFQNSWGNFVNTLNSYAYSQQYKINLASNVIWNWTKYRVSTTAKVMQLAVAATIADAKIRVKIKNNSKDRYWSASISTGEYGYVDIGRALSYREALNMVKDGKSVFTVTKAEAKALAKSAYSNKTPLGPENHSEKNGKKLKGFYYNYFHVYKHKLKGHIWYLF